MMVRIIEGWLNQPSMMPVEFTLAYLTGPSISATLPLDGLTTPRLTPVVFHGQGS